MNTKDNGGDAFPMSTPSDIYPGMTLRDWFAGQALNGMLAQGMGPNSPWFDHPPSAARWAYGIADAMIAERSE